MNQLPLRFIITTDDVQVAGDTAYAYAHGSYTLSGSNGSEVVRGNYLVVDQKVNSEWKI